MAMTDYYLPIEKSQRCLSEIGFRGPNSVVQGVDGAIVAVLETKEVGPDKEEVLVAQGHGSPDALVRTTLELLSRLGHQGGKGDPPVWQYVAGDNQMFGPYTLDALTAWKDYPAIQPYMILNRSSGLWIKFWHLMEIRDRADHRQNVKDAKQMTQPTTGDAVANIPASEKRSMQSMGTMASEQHEAKETQNVRGVGAVFPFAVEAETKREGVEARTPALGYAGPTIPYPEKPSCPPVPQEGAAVPLPKSVPSRPVLLFPAATSPAVNVQSAVTPPGSALRPPKAMSGLMTVSVPLHDTLQSPIPLARPVVPRPPYAAAATIPVPFHGEPRGSFQLPAPLTKPPVPRPPSVVAAATPVPLPVKSQDAFQPPLPVARPPFPVPPSIGTEAPPFPLPVESQDGRQPLHPPLAKAVMPNSLPVAMSNVFISPRSTSNDEYQLPPPVARPAVPKPPVAGASVVPTPVPPTGWAVGESLHVAREGLLHSQEHGERRESLPSSQLAIPLVVSPSSPVPASPHVHPASFAADFPLPLSDSKSDLPLQMLEAEQSNATNQPRILPNSYAGIPSLLASVVSQEQKASPEQAEVPASLNSPSTAQGAIEHPTSANMPMSSAPEMALLSQSHGFMETEDLSAPAPPNEAHVAPVSASFPTPSSRSNRGGHPSRSPPRPPSGRGSSVLPEPIVATHGTSVSSSYSKAGSRNNMNPMNRGHRTPGRSPGNSASNASRPPMRGRGSGGGTGWGPRMPFAGRGARAGNGYGRRTSNADVPVDPPALDPLVKDLLKQLIKAPSMDKSDSTWSALIERAQACLKEGFSGVMEYTLTSSFGTLWLEAVKIQPPWQAKDLLELFVFHKRIPFGGLLSRQLQELIEHFKDFLREVLKEQPSANHALKVISLTKEMFGLYDFRPLKETPGPSLGLIVENATTFEEASKSLKKGKADVQLLFDECVQEIRFRIGRAPSTQPMQTAGRGMSGGRGRFAGRGYMARAPQLGPSQSSAPMTSIQSVSEPTSSYSSAPPVKANAAADAGGEAMAWVRSLMTSVKESTANGYEMLNFVKSMVGILVRAAVESASAIAADLNKVSVLNRVLQKVYQILMALTSMSKEKAEKHDVTLNTTKTVLTGMKDFITLVRLDAFRYCKKLQMPDERFLDEFKGMLIAGKAQSLQQVVSFFDENYRALYNVVKQG